MRLLGQRQGWGPRVPASLQTALHVRGERLDLLRRELALEGEHPRWLAVLDRHRDRGLTRLEAGEIRGAEPLAHGRLPLAVHAVTARAPPREEGLRVLRAGGRGESEDE